MANYIDKTLKIISRHNPDWIKKLIFPDNKEVLSFTSFRLEINIPEKRTDDAFEVTLNNGEKRYLFIEFLFGQDKRAFKTYFVKTAMATDIYGPGSVAALVIQITEGPQEAIEAVYKSKIFGITNSFTMPVIHLNTYLENIEQGTLYQFAPLIPLMKGGADEKVLTTVKRLIQKEKDKKKRSELYASAITIASRYLDKNFLWNFFKEELNMIQDSPIVQEWIDQGKDVGWKEGKDVGWKEGKEEGIEEGGILATQELLSNIIAKRFGVEKQKIVEDIKEIKSIDILESFFYQSLEVKTIDDFYELLKIAKVNSQN